jgi:prepilin-type N-terminal cleavage/methylation domain-containing protein
MRMPSSRGFSLIEMMAILMIIGLAIAIVAPRLSRRPRASEWTHILDELNNLAQFARQESIAEQVVFRLSFTRGKNKNPDIVVVEHQVKNNEKIGMAEFAHASSPYLKTQYSFRDNIRIRGVYLGKKEIFQENSQAFCYVVPDGLIQDVYIQVVRFEHNKEELVTFKMLSFDGQFELIEKPIRPGQEE